MNAGRRTWISRAAAGGALLVGLVLVLVILFGGSSGRTYHLIFENGGQLVSGNQVLVAGQPIGTVNSITLTDDRNADVSISVDEPLHSGTTAVIRATSLSGIANRYVSITPGAEQRAHSCRRGDDRARQHDIDRRSRPALQHVPAADAQGAPERNQGPGAAVRGPHRGRPPQLQVFRARPVDRAPAPGRGHPRPADLHTVPRLRLEGPRRDRIAETGPRGADPERQPGAWRRCEREQLAGPRARGAPAHACARRTRPS